MKGHIRRRGKGRWAVVVDNGQRPDGKRRQKWVTIHGTKRDAERELGKMLVAANGGGLVEAGRTSVREHLIRWLNEEITHRVSPTTLWRYRDIVERALVPVLGGHRLSRLQPQDIQAAYNGWIENGRHDGRGGLSPQTVVHHHRVLRQALAQAVRWNLIAANPAERVRPPRVTRYEPRVLDESAAVRLIDALENSRLLVPVVLAVATGMRRGEILALRWTDVDLGRGTLLVCRSLAQVKGNLRFKDPKSAKGTRTVAMPAFAVECLRRHRIKQNEVRLRLGPSYHDGDLICCRLDGKPWAPATFTTVFMDAIRRHKLPRVRFHDLRHAHASWSAKYGQHPKTVSERLGHSSTKITMDTYTSISPDLQERAAKQLDQAFAAARETSFANRLQTDEPAGSNLTGDSRKAL
ncbi:MAG TPA: tyrosine-type recombinase/integrase [Candidatus Tumulicola sp.]|nr:tyrosine-type recombinase/integrase [Candidatus Tumulicola sp.]